MLKKNLPQRTMVLNAIGFAVFISGFLTIASVLFEQTRFAHSQVFNADAHITILIGLTFIYLATLLRRGKQNAWVIAVPLYAYIVGRNLWHFIVQLPIDHRHFLDMFLNLAIPSLSFIGLLAYRHLFQVKSELRNVGPASKRALLVLLAAFLYGVVGFQLLDTKDFHQEISLYTGAHYTIDQFGLTTDKQVIPATKRAHLFLGSLGALSLGAVFYVGASLFAPIRFRLSGQEHEHETMKQLLQEYPSTSEDYFKLWPHDKAYFFNEHQTAGIAYHVSRGVALVVGDPAGNPADFATLIDQFTQYCLINDWSVAFIHCEDKYLELYRNFGFDAQKIGEEAIVDIDHFQNNVSSNKYFRNIINRFETKGYRFEMLTPPHNEAVIHRLAEISKTWLSSGGRAERGFMMGYFNEPYMQSCSVLVARDAAGTIQGFINQIHTANQSEANFDLLRHTKTGLGNINDYLMLNFVELLSLQGYKQLNMGLAPLAGLGPEDEQKRGLVDSVLGFVYESTSRLYSFQGLKRFKSKYEPRWQARYIVYQDNLPGLTKTATSLLSAMKVKRIHLS